MIKLMIIVMTLDDILRMAERKTLFVQLAGTAFAFVVTIIAIITIILVTQQIPTRCILTRWVCVVMIKGGNVLPSYS